MLSVANFWLTIEDYTEVILAPRAIGTLFLLPLAAEQGGQVLFFNLPFFLNAAALGALLATNIYGQFKAHDHEGQECEWSHLVQPAEQEG
jgi:hypothetical protein